MPNPLKSTCSGRPGVLYVTVGGERFLVSPPNQPTLKCECEAKQVILWAMGRLVFLAAIDAFDPARLPSFEDFEYVYTDSEPEGLDAEPDTQAQKLFSKLMEKL